MGTSSRGSANPPVGTEAGAGLAPDRVADSARTVRRPREGQPSSIRLTEVQAMQGRSPCCITPGTGASSTDHRTFGRRINRRRCLRPRSRTAASRRDAGPTATCMRPRSTAGQAERRTPSATTCKLAFGMFEASDVQPLQPPRHALLRSPSADQSTSTTDAGSCEQTAAVDPISWCASLPADQTNSNSATHRL